MYVRTNRSNGVVVRLGQGGLQRDTTMAEQFAVMYDERVAECYNGGTTT